MAAETPIKFLPGPKLVAPGEDGFEQAQEITTDTPVPQAHVEPKFADPLGGYTEGERNYLTAKEDAERVGKADRNGLLAMEIDRADSTEGLEDAVDRLWSALRFEPAPSMPTKADVKPEDQKPAIIIGAAKAGNIMTSA